MKKYSLFSVNKKIRGLLLLLLLAPLWGVGGLLAQTYPVQINVYALPPYSNQLSDYYSTSREKLVVSLLNRDQQRPELEVELQMTITASSGLTIRNRQGVFYPTITLTQGVMTRLTQDDLAPYLQPQNITQQGYMNQGKLPEGLVEFTFQAIEKYTRRPVSLPATARLWLSAQKPPVLSLPTNGEYVAFREPLNLRFQWTPQHKNISQVEYEFELRELPNNGAAPQSAFLYSPIIHQERLLYTTLMYSAMMPPLDPDKTYGWRVRAIAKDGVDEINMFENNGFSEIWFFKTQINCQAPTGVKATVKDRNIELSWTPAAGNTEYEVQYRSKTATSEEWTTVTANEARATLKSLQRNTTYEFRVGGICGMGKQPVFSDIGEASIEERDLSNCGIAPEVDLSNREPLPELRVGDVVIVGGDFPMTVTMVKGGGNGTFAGEGWTPINWVFESKIAVEFDNLMINTDYRQIGGMVHAKYNRAKSQIADLDGLKDITNNKNNGIIMPDLELDFVIPENPTFEYNAETGELLVFDTAGGEPLVAQLPKNDGKVVFPVIVKDTEGNLYRLEESREDTNTLASVRVDSEKSSDNNLNYQNIDTAAASKKVSDLIVILIERINEKLNHSTEKYPKWAFENRNQLKEITQFNPNADGAGQHINGRIDVGPTNFIKNSSDDDFLSTIYHEFLHYLNWRFKDLPYRMEDVEKGIIYGKLIPCFEERMQSTNEFLERAYISFITEKINGSDIDIYWDYPDFYNELDSVQKKEIDIYIENNNLKPETTCFPYIYIPSNRSKHEIEVHTETLNANDRGVFRMSDEKINFYHREIIRYTDEYNKAKEYEIKNNINPDGYEK